MTTELQGNQLTTLLLSRTGITWEDVTVDDFTVWKLNFSTIELFKKPAKDRLPYIQDEEDPIAILRKLNLLKCDKFKRFATFGPHYRR